MLMAPGPSSWAAGATASRPPVGGDRKFGPKVDLRAVVASNEAPGPHEINYSASTVHCHDVRDKNPRQHDRTMVREHRAEHRPGSSAEKAAQRLRLNLLERADGVRDEATVEDEPQLHSASHGDDAGSAPAA